MTSAMHEFFGEPIDVYSRADAIADGVLVAVPVGAQREAALKVSVALTAAVHAQCVAWQSEDAETVADTEAGRLRELLWMVHNVIKRAQGSRTEFDFAHLPSGEPDGEAVTRLAVQIGPGDQGEPVLTVMLPHEN